MVQEFIVTVISSITVSSLLTSGLIWLSKEWMGTRIKSSIQYEYDQKLEAYKIKLSSQNDIFIAKLTADLEKEAAIQRAVHDSLSEGQKAAMERKLSSIDKLWSALLELRNNTQGILFYFDIISVEEHKTIFENPQYKTRSKSISEEVISKLAVNKDIECVRPYVGEYVWALFTIYERVLLRTIYLISKESGAWFNDPPIRVLLKTALTEEEMNAFDTQQISKISWLKQIIEQKLILSFQRVISGEAFGEETIHQAAKILSATTKVIPKE